MTKTIPKKKIRKKAKWLVEEVLQRPEKRREAKEKQNEKRNDIPTECRVPENSKKKDKKAFLSEQCKEIEKIRTMGKTRDLFKETRDTKGTFHAKMGTI